MQKPVTSKQELDLIQKAKQGDKKAIEIIISKYDRMILKRAKRCKDNLVHKDDLKQEGRLAIMHAIRKYNPELNYHFTGYVSWWIRACLTTYRMKNSRMVCFSNSSRVGRKLFSSLWETQRKLHTKGIRDVDVLLNSVAGNNKKTRYIASCMLQPEIGTAEDQFTSQDPSQEELLQKRRFVETVSQAVDSFAKTLKNEREIVIWNEHIMSDHPLFLETIGEKFGVSKQRIGQIVILIRKKFKEHIAAYGVDGTSLRLYE